MTSPVLSFTGELINHWCRNYREKNDISMQNLHESSRHSGHIPFFLVQKLIAIFMTLDFWTKAL